MKRILISSLWCLMIVACANQQESHENTRQITATAVEFNSTFQNINQTIEKIFDVITCSKKDLLNDEEIYHYSVDNPVFIKINKASLEKVKVNEIADSKDGNYRAYLVDEPSPDICGSCNLSRIYIEDKANSLMSRVDWKDYAFTRNLSNIVWIGNKVLATRQANGSNTFELYGIDVSSKDFVYFSIISCK